jgi:N-acyl-D-aspartate/D-glutamate deacylase
MQSIVRDALAAGAIGWSTSLSAPTHFFGDGTPAPTRLSDDAELDAMARVSREFAHGVIEVAPRSLLGTPDDKLAELDLFDRLARVSGKLVSFAPLHDNPFFPGSAQSILAAAAGRRARGANVVPQVGCRPLELRFDFRAPCFGLENNSFWRPILHEPIAARRAMFAARSSAPGCAATDAGFKALLTPSWERMFLRVPAIAAHRPLVDVSVAAIARERGVHPVDAFLDIALAGDLGDQWGVEVLNADESAVRELITSPDAVVALSGRGRARRYALRPGLHELPPRPLGARSRRASPRRRGRVALAPAGGALRTRRSRHARPGQGGGRRALRPEDGRHATDGGRRRPARGQSRLVQRAEGIPYVLVNGQAVVERGEPTARRPGRVLRAGR